MTHIRHETVITDDGQSIINRDDIQKKLRQLDLYIRKVGRRITQIDTNIQHLHYNDSDKSKDILGIMKGSGHEC